MTIKTLLRGSTLAVSAALVLPSAATAQVTAPVTGIASFSPVDAVFGAKAWIAALTQVPTAFKAQADQITAKQQQRQTLLAQLDTNKDKQVDDAELQAAVTRNDPVVAQITTLERDMQTLDLPVRTAEAYVLDTIAERSKTALQNIMRDRKIAIVLTPQAVVQGPPNTNITQAVVAEIDRMLPSAALTPPPNWQVTEQAAQLFQQWTDYQQQLQQQQAQQAAAAPAGAAGAAPRPAAGAAPAQPARPATQQPSTR